MIKKMKKNFRHFLMVALIFLSTFSLSCKSKKLDKINLKITTPQNEIFYVETELAKTPEQRNFGFMERKNIPDGTGMLFIFEYDQQLSFWMKNTPHPLSIAYIDSNGTIRELHDMKPFSLSPVESSVSVRYALEVPQGWFTKNNIPEGSKISLP